MTSDEQRIHDALAQFLPPRDGARPPATTLGGGHPAVLDGGRTYLRHARAGGWAVPTWPHEYGGRGADAAEGRTIARVRRGFVLPDLYPFMTGLFLVGPLLLECGTPEQRHRWLPPIAEGAEIWCQMFSEPDAGSDLANVATRAVRDGDEWVLGGQKVWTSRAAYADWGLCLARSDPSIPKHQGITAFAVPMAAAGVTVRPLVQMNGDDHFSEVFLDDVRISDAFRLGAVGDGWRMALLVLAHERGIGDAGSGRPKGIPRKRPQWLTDLAERGVLDDHARRDRAISLYVREEVLRLSTARTGALARAGRPGPQGSGLKVLRSRLFQDRAYFVNAARGASGMLAADPSHLDVVTAPSMSIRGGTDEIQRNIVGERVLGLPAEARTDRDVAWSTSRGLR